MANTITHIDNLLETANPPTADNFVYDRRDFPLFFTELSEENKEFVAKNINSIVRSYYKHCRTAPAVPISDILCQVTGCTYGELAMYVIATNHSKRSL